MADGDHHSCDNPPCCNPAHLRFATRLENVRDMVARRRYAAPAKVTDAAVAEMRIRCASGAIQKDLAAAYGVSEAYVSSIVRGYARPNAGGPITKRYRKKA